MNGLGGLWVFAQKGKFVDPVAFQFKHNNIPYTELSSLKAKWKNVSVIWFKFRKEEQSVIFVASFLDIYLMLNWISWTIMPPNSQTLCHKLWFFCCIFLCMHSCFSCPLSRNENLQMLGLTGRKDQDNSNPIWHFSYELSTGIPSVYHFFSLHKITDFFTNAKQEDRKRVLSKV